MTAEAPGARSLLELLLPRGQAVRAVVLGSACPERLRPVNAGAEGDAPLDLVVMAPTVAEGGRAWVAEAIDRCAARLDPDGIAYLLLPRHLRRRARRLLRTHGLALEPAILHLPDLPGTRQLVPLEREPSRHAFTRVVPLVPWKRVTANALFRLGTGAALMAVAPDVALVARRPGARPMLAWLELPGALIGQPHSAVISLSWRSGASSAVLHPFTERGAAPVVAKVALDPAAPASREAERLSRLGPVARQAGARVPELLAVFELQGLPVLLETQVDGEIAAPRLTRRPSLLEGVLVRVCDWLERWQAASSRRRPLPQEQLERELLAPAELLAPMLSNGSAYLAALRERCARLVGAPVPLVASHNDLTMWNVLVDGDGPPGIIDWEAAEEATLPLKDFFYVAADAVAATGGYANRPRAVQECFARDGEPAALVARLQARLAGSLGLEPDLAAICFQACWVGHAANEHRAARPADGRPFLEIVERLAATLRP